MALRLLFCPVFLLVLVVNYSVAQDCSLPNTPPEFKARLDWQSGSDGVSAVATPMVANMNPQEDSLPEIIVLEGSVFGNINNKIHFFHGDGSNANSPFILTVPGNFDFYPAPGPAICDVNLDGIPELLITCADRRIRVFNNYDEDLANIMSLWITSADQVDFIDQRPLLADFDGDGIPEVYAGSDIFKFNFTNPGLPTLNKVLNGPVMQGRAHYAGYNEGSCNPTAVDILSVADCNGDPDCAGLELVAGPMIYSIDLNLPDGDGYQIKTQRDLNTMINPQTSNYKDGYTAVADMDLDGTLDIVVSGERQGNQYGMYIWNKNGLIRFFQYPTNPLNSGSLACIANVFDDKTMGYATDFPEIMVCSSLNFTCFNLHAAQSAPATPYWWNLSTSDFSGWTGSTVYDFNGDGISEIVYRDESNLRILYGGGAPFPPGVDAQRNWFRTPCFSGTSDEYPVVADVDNDGETEIVVTGRNTFNNASTRGRVSVFESDAGPWVPCRNVWNQYNYFIVNINDDLSIPAQQSIHHLELPAPGSGNRPLNIYLSQRPLLNENFEPYIPLSDASASLSDLKCLPDSVQIEINICNYGDKILPTGTPIAFYQSDPTLSNALLLGPIQSTNVPLPIDSCQTFSFTVPKATGPIFGVLNDDGTTPTPYQLGVDFPVTNILECDFLNNLFQFDMPQAGDPINLGPDFSACQDTALMLDPGTAYASYLWQDGSTSQVFQAQQAGVYWVEVTDICAEKYRDTINVILLNAPDIQLDTINGDCFGKPSGLSAAVQSIYPPFQYAWSSGDNQPSLSGLPDGTYTVTVTNAKGCTSVDSTWVEAGGSLQVSAAVAAPILCYGQNGTLSLSFLQGNPPYVFQWSNGNQTQDLPNASAGDYSVTITDSDLCVDTVQISINQPEALISNGLVVAPTCPGQATGALAFQGAGQGTPPYTLLWSNNETTPNLAGLSTGAYQLTITDANGCSMVEAIQVPAFVAPDVTPAETDVSCFGAADGQIEVNLANGSPGFGYIWSNSVTSSQNQNLQVGNYALTLTYANGACAQTFDFSIAEPLPILLSTANTDIQCHGDQAGAIDLSVQNGVTPMGYLWSNNAQTEDLTAVGAGSYQVTVTDASGCTAVVAAQLTEPTALLSAGLSAVPACPGEANGSASFLGASQGTPPYQLLWSTNATSASLSGLPAGNYQLTLTDDFGCSLIENVQVQEFLPPSVQENISNVNCFGEQNGSISTQISGGTPGFGYLWSNNATSPNISNLAPGDYSLSLTYANGTCQQSFDYQITEPPLLALSDTLVSPVQCFGEQNGAIATAALGGVSPYLFHWSGNQNTEDISGLSAGTYALTLTDKNGCTLLAAFTVPQPSALSLTALIGADTCESADGAIAMNAFGGVPSYQYAWSNAVTAQNQANLPTGTYVLTVTDANACTETLAVQIPAYGEIPTLIPFSNTLNCIQNSVNIGVTVNQNNLHYTWLSPNGSLPDQATHTVQSAGNYQVSATNAFGCGATAQLVVLEDLAVPTAEAGPANLDLPCDVTVSVLNAGASSQGPGFQNQWLGFPNNAPAFDTFSLALPIVEAGLYIHKVLNLNNGCQAQDSILVDWNTPILAGLLVNPIRCFGADDGQIEFQNITGGTAPLSYSIDNQPFTSQISFSDLGPGSYLLRIRDNLGCNWEQTVTLSEPEPLAVELTASNTVLSLGQTLQLNALPTPAGADLAEIEWEPLGLNYTPMSLQQRLKPETHTEFVVRITDQNGCVAEDRLSVSVYNHNIYVPNIILPGSEENSWFTVFAGDGVQQVQSLRVFDRWGEQMFERFDFLPNIPEFGWDGDFRGQAMNPGVFVWYAEVLLQDGQVVFLKGDVTVVR